MLDVETRILAVADVYDALVSSRVYREAWSSEQALALLHDGAGTQFDARCVAELELLTAGTTRPRSDARPAPARRIAAVAQASGRPKSREEPRRRGLLVMVLGNAKPPTSVAAPSWCLPPRRADRA